MQEISLGKNFLKELEAEAAATRHCLERIPADLFGWKPHDKSMDLGTLAYLVADIPHWVRGIIEDPDINFATWQRVTCTTPEELVSHFDQGMDGARRALASVTDDGLTKETFHLKSGDQVLMEMPKDESISSTINHMVHHRGQLTVFMRLKDIKVPSIYGPSADEPGF